MNNKCDSDYVINNLSYIEGDNIGEKLSKLPILSYISYIDNDDEYNDGGFLIGIRKNSFKIITNPHDDDSIIKVKFLNIKKIYFVENKRTYHKKYNNEHRERKNEINRQYYQRKKDRLLNKKNMVKVN
jgi:hypothetical protein